MHTRYSLTISFVLTCLLLSASLQPAWSSVAKKNDDNLKLKVQSVQIPFLENTGQLKDNTIRFWARTLSGAVHVTESGALLYSLPQISASGTHSGWVLREEFVNSLKIQARGEEPTDIAVNFINGDRESDWRSKVPVYNQVFLGEIYPGIEARLKAYGNNVEKLFLIRPDTDPGAIFIAIAGAEGLTLGPKGELEIETGLGTVCFTPPLAYQEINGQRQYITVAYSLEAKGYRFTVGPYDHSKALVIDPLLASTFIGEGVDPSSGPPGVTVAVDTNGQVFVAGSATTNFPTTLGVYSPNNNGGNDVFVLAMDRDLTALQVATFIGGSSDDRAYSMAVGDGYLMVSGWTQSTNFPTHLAGYDRTHNGADRDIFVARLSKDLSPASYKGSFLGGSGNEQTYGIALQGSSVYLTGSSSSPNFPVTDSSTMGDSAPKSFIAKMDIELTQLEKSTLYGGDGSDEAFSIALGANTVYIGGYTTSTNLPGTGYDADFNGGDEDGFIAHFTAALDFSGFTYLGGNGNDRIFALALDADGNLFAVGGTGSPNFPATSGSYDPGYNGGSLAGNDSPSVFNSDGFIAKFSATLGDLQAATFWGGKGDEITGALAFDSNGNILLSGETSSNDLPVSANAYQPSPAAASDTYLVKLDDLLQNVVAASYLGGGSRDTASSLFYFAANDSVYLTGISWSSDFPTTASSYQQEHIGAGPNIFVAKLDVNFSENLHAIINSTPGSYNYGSVAVAAPTAKKFVVSNHGNTDLIFEDISLSGTDPYQFAITNDSCSTAALSPASSCNMTITFTPLSTGVKNANLKFISNATNSPTLTVSLTGTGTGATVTKYTLTIQKDGSRVGVVTSEFGELNCGPTCTYTYDANAIVNLTPSWNQETTVFSGWSGGCSGTGACTVTMTQNTTIKATFRDFYPTEISKTGLTSCFDSAGSSIACSGTGQDGEIQAGVLTPKPRFTDNNDGTITDNLTGLMWLQDANCFSGDLFGFVWLDALGTINNFNLNPSHYDCAFYDDKYNDWVLPNINELESLLTDETSSTKQEWLYDQNFENVVAFGDYWTSTTWAGNDSFAWYIYTSNGIISYQSKSREKAFIWPVRSE